MADVCLFAFYVSRGLVRVCEKELSNMGKSNGTPDLVCEIFLSHMGKSNGNPDLVCKKELSHMGTTN